MDLRRVRSNEWLCGGFGVLLIASLFLHYYRGVSGWEAFAVTDIVLTAAGLLGVALLVGTATQRTPAVQQSLAAITCPVAFVATVLLLIRAVWPPGDADRIATGLVIAGLAVTQLLAAAWRSMGDQRFPADATPQVEITPLPAPRSEPAADE